MLILFMVTIFSELQCNQMEIQRHIFEDICVLIIIVSAISTFMVNICVADDEYKIYQESSVKTTQVTRSSINYGNGNISGFIPEEGPLQFNINDKNVKIKFINKEEGYIEKKETTQRYKNKYSRDKEKVYTEEPLVEYWVYIPIN